MSTRPTGGGIRAAVAAGATVALAALVPIVVAGRSGGGRTPAGAGAAEAPAEVTAYLLDADADGAVVEDGAAGLVRGVRSSGGTAWSDARAYAEAASVICAGRCPAAVASAGIASRVPPGEPDPAPRALGRGPLSPSLDPRAKRRVLAADDGATVVVVGDGDGPAWLEAWAGDRLTARVAVPSVDTAWLPTSDRSAAATVTDTADPHRFEVRAWRRGADGWTIGGDPVASSVPFGCTGGRGGVIVADPRPRLVGPAGPPIPVPGLRTGGECAFGAGTAVVAQLSATARGPVAEVVVIDDSGSVRWRADVGGETRVRADRGSDRFVVVADGTTVERSADGTVLRTVAGTDDARYDERGQLVVLHRDGSVRWLR
jgi:hypothetical protein